MPAKKKPEPDDREHREHAKGSSLGRSQSQPQSQPKKPAESKTAPPKQPPQEPVLLLCRNKHWPYISSFHGPWLKLAPEVLATIADVNYSTPRPHPINPAIFSDLIKIRRLVDEATDLAVRAASDVTSIGQRSLPFGVSHHAAALGLGDGLRPPPQARLSPERRHRMRVQATQKLVTAYRLDEIACSVAVMQSASSLEEVAALVLQRNPHDADAKYVQFLHEKIPSRELADYTSLEPLDKIVAATPGEPEPLKTRALIRAVKGDHQGAVDDLTHGLRLHRLYRPAHARPGPPSQESGGQLQQQGSSRRQDDIISKPDDQPSSLEMQLLIQRAAVYLGIACGHIAAAIPHPAPTPRGSVAGSAASESLAVNGDLNGTAEGEMVAAQLPEPELSPAEIEARQKVVEATKLVRHNAKRALRDYTAFLSHFEYSPNLPIEAAEDFTRKVNLAVYGGRTARFQNYLPAARSPVVGVEDGADVPHRVFALSELFTSSPPAGLPPYPNTELASIRPEQALSPGVMQMTTESVTCHPVLVDALHALLLCHCLIQTSPKELLRHAYMVARLARRVDGHPVLESSRCPARVDWIEVLRMGGNWIQLDSSWDDLCVPPPVLASQSRGGDSATTSPFPPTALARLEPGTAAAAAEKRRKLRIQRQIICDTLGDERITDDASLRQAIRARQLRAKNDKLLGDAVAHTFREFEPPTPTPPATTTDEAGPIPTNNSTPSPAVPAAATTETAPSPTSTSASASLTTNGNSTNNTPTTALPTGPTGPSSPDDTKDGGAEAAAAAAGGWSFSTERATAIARWVLEAPPPSSSSAAASGTGTGAANGGNGGNLAGRRRKKKKNTAVVVEEKKKADGSAASSVSASAGSVSLGD
ncbi:hypothetical protein BT67DRAFT_436889 [Trichocladium antarcticum]|uniref:Histidine kinase group protein n=1 Tax=Trichocladium antarcticum TaxID=1450529 RepID=A0AAN6UCW2_9PEZI|nr:hypothetical protein BT67DRAFT_436889 [Trichocladium antarcticum]